MAQELNPKTAFTVIGLVVVLAVGALCWTMARGSFGFGGDSKKLVRPAMSPKNEPRGPDAAEKQSIDEWRKKNPGAYTRF